ncbi:MAG TPA: hypothetical protein VF658_08055 [Pyrinomonadaceae bacterium]|jgi:hypothetical protein
MPTTRVLQDRKVELDKLLDALSQKITRLERARVHEAVEVRLIELEYHIEEAKKARFAAVEELQDVERQIGDGLWVSNPHPLPEDALPPTKLTILTCDRTAQEKRFTGHFTSLADSRRQTPQFYFIHGDQWDSPDSLVFRFRDTTIRKYIDDLPDESKPTIEYRELDWSYLDSLVDGKRDLSNALFSCLGNSYKEKDYSATALSRLLSTRFRNKLLIVHHKIRAEDWGRTARRVLQWYQSYWDEVKGDAELPLCVLFVSIIYPPEQADSTTGDQLQRRLGRELPRLRRKLWKKRFIFMLKHYFDWPERSVKPRSATHCCSSIVLDELGCITMDDFLTWLKRADIKHNANLLAQWCKGVFGTDDPLRSECKKMFHIEAKLDKLRQDMGDLWISREGGTLGRDKTF